MTPPGFGLAVFLVITAAGSAPAQPPDVLAPMQTAVAAAERALSDNEHQMAESEYRTALFAGWMAMGALASADGRFTDSRDAFRRASTTIVDSGDAQQSLAMVDLRLGDAAAAIPLLTSLSAAHPKDTALQRLLAQAFVAARQPEQAVQILLEAHNGAPEDIETTFALATGYLRLAKPDAARPLFAQLAESKPRPETWVLIGRAYRDGGRYEDARSALKRALALNPRIRHAYYYLGTAAVMQDGVVRIDEAIDDFKHELAISPADPATTILLGMALVEAHHESEALPLLQAAAGRQGAGSREFQYLGRCELALGHAREAVVALRKALAAAADVPPGSGIGNLHYQLAQALRAAGDTQAAEAEFAIAASAAANRADTRRDTLQHYLTEAGDAPGDEPPSFSLDSGPLAKLSPDARQALRARAATALASVYLNLGILDAQARRFGRASDLMQEAATLDPALPRLQYSLGVVCFNAQQYDRAAAALERALGTQPQNADARRMLALASLHTQAFARAAELLQNDAELQRNPSLQYAYGVALVHSGHAPEAERLFSSLLASHADDPRLTVLLGEAHAEQGDYDGAIATLQRAIALQPGIPDANRTLGVIYMKQGKLAEAASALRAELASHADDLAARSTLATVLDMSGDQAQALGELARVLRARPNDADARYLMGKILLARGSAADAVEHLEIAARLAPQDANIHYQLGQAYQKLGRGADAQKEFDRFQQLKADRHGGGQ
jgi:tetratricopeptide (TPR) repeat protein